MDTHSDSVDAAGAARAAAAALSPAQHLHTALAYSTAAALPDVACKMDTLDCDLAPFLSAGVLCLQLLRAVGHHKCVLDRASAVLLCGQLVLFAA